MEKISEHISLKEAIFSKTAMDNSIKNIPTEEQLKYMKVIAEKIFEPLRKGLGDRPILISSFFRSKDLNDFIGGSSSSQHLCLNGDAAMDLDNDLLGEPDNAQIFFFIKNNLEFDQLIWEFGNEKKPDWVHVSYRSKLKNRKQVLKSIIQNGRKKYIPFA